MENYDVILKDEKKYIEEEPKKKSPFKKLFYIDILIIIICLLISYIYYYKNINTPDKIVIKDINIIKEKLDNFITPLKLDIFKDNYSLDGKININSQEYNFEYIRDNSKLKILLEEKDKHKLNYYLSNNIFYTQIDDLLNKQYASKLNYNKLNILYNFKNNFNKVIENSDYIKRLYLEQTTPIVEVNLVLDNKKLSELLGENTLTDEYQVTLTFKNNSITNEIIESKIIISNKTKNKRILLEYKNDMIYLTDNNGEITKIKHEQTEKNETLKFFKEEKLYSIFTLEKNDNSYEYSYQKIDVIHNVKLHIAYGDKTMEYYFHYNVEDDKENKKGDLIVTANYHDDSALDDSISNTISYNTLDKNTKQTFDDTINNFISPIKNFINEYKEKIN